MPNLLIPVFIFAILFLLEIFFPLRVRRQPLIKRIPVNIILSGFVFITGSLLIRPLSIWTTQWTYANKFGVLELMPLSLGGKFVAGFLLMDLTFYYWHRANHTVGFFRRFHKVHHIDPELDIFTSFRFHFGEILYSAGFRAAQVGLIGVSLTGYLAYEFVFVCATMFHHSNVNLPVRFERALNIIFVTPRMHGVHHSVRKNETNSDYSVIFSCWDRLHDSLRLNIPQNDIEIGVAGYQRDTDNELMNLLMTPFTRSGVSAQPSEAERNAAIDKTLMLE